MNTEMTFPHTFESGITILKITRNGAYLITDGLNVAFIISNYIRRDGTLTACGQKALLDSNKTLEQYEEENNAWKKAKEEKVKAWKKAKEEGAKLVTYIIEKGILKSGGPYSYKYACGRGYDMYHRVCTHYVYLPKNRVEVERKNNKVYVTLPKWLAEKHSIFNTVA